MGIWYFLHFLLTNFHWSLRFIDSKLTIKLKAITITIRDHQNYSWAIKWYNTQKWIHSIYWSIEDVVWSKARWLLPSLVSYKADRLAAHLQFFWCSSGITSFTTDGTWAFSPPWDTFSKNPRITLRKSEACWSCNIFEWSDVVHMLHNKSAEKQTALYLLLSSQSSSYSHPLANRTVHHSLFHGSIHPTFREGCSSTVTAARKVSLGLSIPMFHRLIQYYAIVNQQWTSRTKKKLLACSQISTSHKPTETGYIFQHLTIR